MADGKNVDVHESQDYRFDDFMLMFAKNAVNTTETAERLRTQASVILFKRFRGESLGDRIGRWNYTTNNYVEPAINTVTPFNMAVKHGDKLLMGKRRDNGTGDHRDNRRTPDADHEIQKERRDHPPRLRLDRRQCLDDRPRASHERHEANDAGRVPAVEVERVAAGAYVQRRGLER